MCIYEDFCRESLIALYSKLIEYPFPLHVLLPLYRDISELSTDKNISKELRINMTYSLGNILKKVFEIDKEKFSFLLSQSLSKQIIENPIFQDFSQDNSLIDEFLEPSEEYFFEQRSVFSKNVNVKKNRKNHLDPKKKTYSSALTGAFITLLEDGDVDIRQASLNVLLSMFGMVQIESIEKLLLLAISDFLCDESPMIVLMILDRLKEKTPCIPIPSQTIYALSILLQSMTLLNAREMTHELLRQWRVQDESTLTPIITSLLFCMEKKIDHANYILETACRIGDLNAEIIKETTVWTRLLQVDPLYLPVEPSLLDPFCKFSLL